MTTCYCGQHLPFENCCQPYIENLKNPDTAVTLMRSRYSAFAAGNATYLIATTHTSTRKLHTKSAISDWAKSNHWTKLEIVDVTEFTVTFRAYYIDNHKLEQTHFEKSNFVFENGSWFYVDGIVGDL